MRPGSPPPPADDAVGIDLELDGRGRLTALGATRGSEILRVDAESPRDALEKLDRFAEGAAFIFGHNVYWHDLRWLHEHAPELGLLRLPAVDTLVLSALAFAEHPYHSLAKDYKLVREARNDPAADAILAARVLADCAHRMRQIEQSAPGLVAALVALAPGLDDVSPHAARGLIGWLTPLATPDAGGSGALHAQLTARACGPALARCIPPDALPAEQKLAALFTLPWLRVASTPDGAAPSVTLPWVRRTIPGVAELVTALRARPCDRPECSWCRDTHDPAAFLRRWFGFPGFRDHPTLSDGRPAQAAIVEAGCRGESLLALLPTGAGKSLCFQIPAIQRYIRRGSLTLVISPLQSLMHDQVDNFGAKTGAHFAHALTGALRPAERRAVLDGLTSGACGILYIAPEQLRNPGFRRAIANREIGAWVFDEAHCVAKWGHDFRPDYLYAARFVREFSLAQESEPPPIVCVTATARPDVAEEIREHFRTELGRELALFDGHAARDNLTLRVESAAGVAKTDRLVELTGEQLALAQTGAVLVYTATRKHAETAAAHLTTRGIDAEPFHAGLPAPRRKEVQDAFLRGDLRVVCATNAFGMGVDKPDIRLVIHLDVPGSLEAYVQEVGRAGRDGAPARAVLLFADDDIETQFRLTALSALTQRDLQDVLRRVRALARHSRRGQPGQAVCTPGEILDDEDLAERIPPSDRGAPTQVVTAIAWLERGRFLRRDENATTVFQGAPLVETLDEARARIAKLDLPEGEAAAWEAILSRMMTATEDEGLTSDDLYALPEVVARVQQFDSARAGRAVLRMLVAMQRARLLSKGVQLTAFVRHGIADSSKRRLAAFRAIENTILELMAEQCPDPEPQAQYPLHVRPLTAAVLATHDDVHGDQVRRALRALAELPPPASNASPHVDLRSAGRDRFQVRIQGDWPAAIAVVRRQRELAELCLDHMLASLDAGARGKALLVRFALEDLISAKEQDLMLHSSPSPTGDAAAEIEYALLYLHRIDAVLLHKGLAVFRQAMTLSLPDESPRRFTKRDFGPLHEHQEQRTVQIHVMREFAQRMIEHADAGLALLDDYFREPMAAFLDRHFPRRSTELARATSAESWRRIVQDLSAEQRQIVEAPEDRSMLVLAGPGSGKTRVVVHRCAYLVRVRRVPPRSILVLCFNRSAATELRARLHGLVGAEGRGVLIQTYHSMALRLTGRVPTGGRGEVEAELRGILDEAVRLLEPRTEQDDGEASDAPLRDRLLGGFRHILVDEYQDIDAPQYRLVAAIAGRSLEDAERRLSVLAVGDDDQNIYSWRGTNVAYIRRFESDYGAERVSLVENFRSTAHIIEAANALIEAAPDRLKGDAPIRIDSARRHLPAGGPMADGASAGRVRIVELDRSAHQPAVVLGQLRRLAARVDGGFSWRSCAVLSSRRDSLDGLRAILARHGIPTRRRIASGGELPLHRLREVELWLQRTKAMGQVDVGDCRAALTDLRTSGGDDAWLDFLEGLLPSLEDALAMRVPWEAFRYHLFATLAEHRRERWLGDGVTISTAHGAKGEEYDFVIVLDDGWGWRARTNPEETRRLYYVAMTRARSELTLLDLPAPDGVPWLVGADGGPWYRVQGSLSPEDSPVARTLRYAQLGLGDVWLDFAGSAFTHERLASRLRTMRSDDRLRAERDGDRLFLATSDGLRVGALTKEASAPYLHGERQILAIRASMVLGRRRDDSEPGFADRLRREHWWVLLPEIAFVPGRDRAPP